MITDSLNYIRDILHAQILLDERVGQLVCNFLGS